jgi:hypothetical protein
MTVETVREIPGKINVSRNYFIFIRVIFNENYGAPK